MGLGETLPLRASPGYQAEQNPMTSAEEWIQHGENQVQKPPASA